MTTSLIPLGRSRTVPRMLTTFALLVTAAIAVLAPTPTPAAAANLQLYAGHNEYSTTVNCASIALGSPWLEGGIGTYIGFEADPDAGKPAVNENFYVEVYVAGLGFPCGGQHVAVELALPAGVALNVGPSTPIQCYAGTQLMNASVCAQSMQPSPYHAGALWYPSPDTAKANTWPLAQGSTWRFRFPVRSSSLQNSALLQAYIQVLDGWDNPLLVPKQGLYVFNGSTPTVLYPAPSTAFTPVPNSVNFTTKSTTTIYKPPSQTGTVLFDIATTPSFASVLFTDSGPVPTGAAPEIFTDWVPAVGSGNTFAIQPNTNYYWRARYQPSTGGQVVGATQQFTTPNAGAKTVGNGTAASCTQAALKAAFTPYTERVDFNCGLVPVTIQLDDGYITDGPLTIDGGGSVTLVAAPNTRIFQHNSDTLTLRRLTLKGADSNGCGGALQVLNGSATLDRVRFLDNHAAAGGGLCVMGGTSAEIYDSLFSGNVSDTSGGGIYAGGNVSLWRSEVSNNVANSDGGGGVYSDATYFDAFYSLFAANTANGATYGRGGGILIESGTYGNVAASTISGNTAVKGGGLHNEGDTYVTGATIADNTSTGAGRGGGIESETTGFAAVLHVRNTIIAGNRNTSSGAAAGANCASTNTYRQHVSLGHNIVGDSTCNFNEFGDQQNTDPMLRPLATNGGNTRTHAIPVNSPAVDSADSTYCGMYDQRGANDGSTTDAVSRSLDSDGNGSKICDRGAYELVPGPVFVPITPARLMDTRPATGSTDSVTQLSTNTNVTVDGQAQNLGLRSAGTTTVLKVTDRVDVPGDALAVSVNLTAVGSTAAGALIAFPCGVQRPFATTLSYDAAATIANAALVPVGIDGTICIYNSSATNVLVDINGYVPAASRYQGLAGVRYVDTRTKGITFDSVARRGGAIPAGTSRTYQISGRGSVASGTAAVMLEVTVPAPAAGGYLTVYPCGTMPPTSSMNVQTGVTTTNAVFTGLSNTGTICVFASTTMDVVIDVIGSVPAGTTLTPLSPQRLLDTRPASAQPTDDGVNTVRPAGSVTEVLLKGRGGVSNGATTVVLNVAAVGPAARGYLTVYPCGATRPTSSNVNYVAGVNRANLVVVKVPTSGPGAGKVCIFTSQQTHLIADVNGQVT